MILIIPSSLACQQGDPCSPSEVSFHLLMGAPPQAWWGDLLRRRTVLHIKTPPSNPCCLQLHNTVRAQLTPGKSGHIPNFKKLLISHWRISGRTHRDSLAASTG